MHIADAQVVFRELGWAFKREKERETDRQLNRLRWFQQKQRITAIN